MNKHADGLVTHPSALELQSTRSWMIPVRDVARLCDIPAGHGLSIAVETGTVALFKVAGAVFAVDDACIRCGSSLANGALDGSRVSCSACGWQYDVVTGCTVGVPELRLDTFEVSTSGENVSIANHFSSLSRKR